MRTRWVPKLSILLTVALFSASITVWQTGRASAAQPSVTVGVDLASAELGAADYRLTVTNRGEAAASDVQLFYRVPARSMLVLQRGTEAASGNCRGEVPAGSECSWELGELEPEEARVIQLHLRVEENPRSESISNSAWVTDGDTEVSRHTNEALYMLQTRVSPELCEGRPSAGRMIERMGRDLTGGHPLERLWDHSLDCSDPLSPEMASAAQATGPPSCIDVDPETSSGSGEQRLEALVTDGTVSGRTEEGADSCSGNPVSGVEIVWTIEEDDPDAYFSSNEEFPTTGQPNTITSISDSGTGAGKTAVSVRLAAPGATGENRVSGRFGNDVREEPTDEFEEVQCLTPPPLGFGSCPGEAANEDDVIVAWVAGSASPTSTVTGSPTGSPTASSTVSPTTSATPTPSATTTSTGSPRPSGSPSRSASPSPSGPGLARTATLFASKPRVVFNGSVTFSGRLFSSNPSCDDAGETVNVRQRVHGTNGYEDISSLQTDAQGNFQFTTKVQKSADYIAVAPSHDGCAEAASASVTVLVRVKVRMKAADPTVRQGGTLVLVGKVIPKHSGQVLIQLKQGKKWRRVLVAQLNKRSSFRTSVQVDWRGNRFFRAKFQEQDRDHEPNKSKPVPVRAG